MSRQPVQKSSSESSEWLWSFECTKSGLCNLTGFAIMLLAVRLKWHRPIVIGLF